MKSKVLALIFSMCIYTDMLIAQLAFPCSIEPTWQVSIFIENGDGRLDTLFIGYDESASGLAIDTNFCEYSETFDYSNDSIYKVFWMDALGNTAKIAIVDQFYTEPKLRAIDLVVQNGTPPFKVWTDLEAMYSIDLPFGQDNSNIPNGWITIHCANPFPFYSNCSLSVPSLISDSFPTSVVSEFWDTLFVLNGPIGSSFSISEIFHIEEWGKEYSFVGGETYQSIEIPSVSPNPVKDFCIIESDIAVSFQIFDIGGRICLEGGINGPSELLDISMLDSGIYMIRFSGLESSFLSNHKILKL